jgi:hypothetical protein
VKRINGAEGNNEQNVIITTGIGDVIEAKAEVNPEIIHDL